MNGSSLWFPPQGSTYAADQDALYYFVYYCSIVLFVLVVGAILYFAIKYRRRGAATRTDGRDHNLAIEITWTVIPTIVVMIIFVWGFRDFLERFVVPHDAMEIKVTGQRWFWTFDYPEGANSVNELVVPSGRPIKLLMSSKDVLHSFFIPDMRMKMDVLPNRYTVTWFEPVGTGEGNIFCTEYCGKGHSEMIGRYRVVSEKEYADWMEKSTSGEGMSLEEFGAKLYVSKACKTCHSVDGSKNTGPSFQGIFGTPVLLKNGQTVNIDENYLRQSILDPQSQVVAGYEPVMPTFQGVLKDRQLDALIAYIKSLQNK